MPDKQNNQETEERVSFSWRDREATLRVTLDFRVTLDSARRRIQAQKYFEKALRRFDAHEIDIAGGAVAGRFTDVSPERMSLIRVEAGRTLRRFLKEQLYPAVVEEALHISSRERSRWTKDGRLPNSGSGSFRRGSQTVYFVLHPQEEILALALNPETIAAWRQQDALGKAAAQEE